MVAVRPLGAADPGRRETDTYWEGVMGRTGHLGGSALVVLSNGISRRGFLKTAGAGAAALGAATMGVGRIAGAAPGTNPDPGHVKGPDGITPAVGGESELYVYPRNQATRDPANVQWAVDNVMDDGVVHLLSGDSGDGEVKPFNFGAEAYAVIKKTVTVVGEGPAGNPSTTILGGWLPLFVHDPVIQDVGDSIDVIIQNIHFDNCLQAAMGFHRCRYGRATGNKITNGRIQYTPVPDQYVCFGIMVLDVPEHPHGGPSTGRLGDVVIDNNVIDLFGDVYPNEEDTVLHHGAGMMCALMLDEFAKPPPGSGNVWDGGQGAYPVHIDIVENEFRNCGNGAISIVGLGVSAVDESDPDTSYVSIDGNTITCREHYFVGTATKPIDPQDRSCGIRCFAFWNGLWGVRFNPSTYITNNTIHNCPTRGISLMNQGQDDPDSGRAGAPAEVHGNTLNMVAHSDPGVMTSGINLSYGPYGVCTEGSSGTFPCNAYPSQYNTIWDNAVCGDFDYEVTLLDGANNNTVCDVDRSRVLDEGRHNHINSKCP